MATKKKYHEVTVFLTEDRKADKGLQSTVFLTTLSLLPLRLERRGSLLGPIQPSPFRRPHRHTHAAAAGGKRGSDAHAKNEKQPIPLPWSWEEFASSPYCATSNFLTQITKLLKPDSAASGRHGRKPLGTDRPLIQT